MSPSAHRIVQWGLGLRPTFQRQVREREEATAQRLKCNVLWRERAKGSLWTEGAVDQEQGLIFTMSTNLQYRGVPYDAASHERTSELPVAHTYRGQSFLAPLRHPPTSNAPELELRYRGRVYRSHRGQAIQH